MPTAENARHGVLRLARYAVAAGGLSLGWLLLAGGAAHASSASTTTAPAPSAVASTHAVEAQAAAGRTPSSSAGLGTVGRLLQPVVSIVRTGTGTVSATVGAVPTTVADVQGTTSTVVTTTTSTLSGVVQQTVPAVVDPVLTGPLAPLAPLVNQTTSILGGTVSSVGGTVGGTVSELPLSQVTQPVAQLGQTIVGPGAAAPSPVQTAPATSSAPLPQAAASAPPSAPISGAAAVPKATVAASSATASQGARPTDWTQTLALSDPTGGHFRSDGASEAGPTDATGHGTGPERQPGQTLLGGASSSALSRGGNHNPLAVESVGNSPADGHAVAGNPQSRLSSLLEPPAFDPGSTPD